MPENKQKEFRLPHMILQREDVEEILGNKAYILSDKKMEKIADLMTEGFMNDWASALRCAITTMQDLEEI